MARTKKIAKVQIMDGKIDAVAAYTASVEVEDSKSVDVEASKPEAEALDTLEKAEKRLREKTEQLLASGECVVGSKSAKGGVVGVKVGSDQTVAIGESLWHDALAHGINISSDGAVSTDSTVATNDFHADYASGRGFFGESLTSSDENEDEEMEEWPEDEYFEDDDDAEDPPSTEEVTRSIRTHLEQSKKSRGMRTYNTRGSCPSKKSSEKYSSNFYGDKDNCTVASNRKRCWKCERELPSKRSEEDLCPECFKKAEASISMHSL